ncbi:unnamed protein product, partial [Staurois parvus]
RLCTHQGQTDNSCGPQAIGNHGAPVSLPKLQKAYEKGTRGISWGPLVTPGPQALPKCSNGQSAPATHQSRWVSGWVISLLQFNRITAQSVEDTVYLD